MSNSKTVFQYDGQGVYVGPTEADESPLEIGQGVYLIPAQCVEVAPPTVDGIGLYLWTGTEWVDYTPAPTEAPVEIQTLTTDVNIAEVVVNPLDKLKTFLAMNPDVAELLK